MDEGQRYNGRLELTWTNKNLRLLARDDGRYAWVPPADYRVAEVLLLRDAGTAGAVAAPDARARDNLLIRSDALNALHSLAALPEFAREALPRLRPGSTLRKIPASILGEYRDERRWYAADATGVEPATEAQAEADMTGAEEAITV